MVKNILFHKNERVSNEARTPGDPVDPDDHAVVQHGISSYRRRMTLQWWRASGNRVT